MSLHSIPVLGQIASSLQTSLRQVDAALGGAGGQVGRGFGRMRSFLPPGISSGAGCGVAVGYGWGVGLFVSESSMRAAMNSIASRVGQLNGSSTDSPVQQLSGPGSIRPAPIIPSAQSPIPPAPSDSDLLNLSKMLLKQQVVIDEMEKRLQVLEAKVPDPNPNTKTGSNAQ